MAFLRHEMSGSNEFIILTLGESTTSQEYPYSWPSQLGDLLRDRYPGIKIQVVNKARSGVQTSEVVGNIEDYISAYNPDVIVSMMGINDIPYDKYNNSLYAPVIGNTPLRIIKLVRLLRRYGEIAYRHYSDFVVNGSSEYLNRQASEFRRHGLYEEAELYLQKSLKSDPKNIDTYLALSYVYRESWRIAEAKRALFHVLALEPANDIVYNELGIFYRDTLHNQSVASEYFRKVIELNDQNGQAYFDYGANILYLDGELAAEMLQKAIVLRPDLDWAYFYLAELHERKGNESEAEVLYKEVLERDPENEVANMKLTHLHDGVRSGQVAGVSTQSGEPLYGGLRTFHPLTRQNYSRIAAAADAYNIPLVAMQYPLQPIEPLEKLFTDTGVTGSGVVIVSNVENFRNALQIHGYDYLFVDHFGGNFGHATREGNRFIAESVAAVVEKFIVE